MRANNVAAGLEEGIVVHVKRPQKFPVAVVQRLRALTHGVHVERVLKDRHVRDLRRRSSPHGQGRACVHVKFNPQENAYTRLDYHVLGVHRYQKHVEASPTTFFHRRIAATFLRRTEAATTAGFMRANRTVTVEDQEKTNRSTSCNDTSKCSLVQDAGQEKE